MARHTREPPVPGEKRRLEGLGKGQVARAVRGRIRAQRPHARENGVVRIVFDLERFQILQRLTAALIAQFAARS